MNQTSKAAASSNNRRALSPAQKKCLPLLPIFQACKARGLKCSDETRTARLYAVNRYLNNFEQFDWIETSFKELLGQTAAILVIADAIERGAIRWN